MSNHSAPTPVHLELGARAEQLAAAHLEKHGLRILERNYRCAVGEIDIIARGSNADTIFVEVRYRSRPDYGGPAESIDARKQARLLRAARHWIQKHDPREQSRYRFDVVTVVPDTDGQSRLDWLQNAISEH